VPRTAVRPYRRGNDASPWNAAAASAARALQRPGGCLGGGAPFLSAQAVTTNSDYGPGSLRQTIADAPGGATVTFDGSFSGQSISLANGGIHIANRVVIDASALADGVILNGHGKNAL
jgi:hypothetical protein